MSESLLISINVSNARLDIAILPSGEASGVLHDEDGHARLLARLGGRRESTRSCWKLPGRTIG